MNNTGLLMWYVSVKATGEVLKDSCLLRYNMIEVCVMAVPAVCKVCRILVRCECDHLPTQVDIFHWKQEGCCSRNLHVSLCFNLFWSFLYCVLPLCTSRFCIHSPAADPSLYLMMVRSGLQTGPGLKENNKSSNMWGVLWIWRGLCACTSTI